MTDHKADSVLAAILALGYVRGLQSKLRQIRRRYVLVRKDRAGDLVKSLTAAVVR